MVPRLIDGVSIVGLQFVEAAPDLGSKSKTRKHLPPRAFLREVSDANEYRTRHRTRHLSGARRDWHLWPDMARNKRWGSERRTIIDWIAQGQFDRPLRVVAFNTEEGWSHDMTRNIAMKLLDLNQDGVALGSAAREFVERVTGRSATVIV